MSKIIERGCFPADPLRTCKCGCLAFTVEDLELFQVCKACTYGRSMRCNKCRVAYSKSYRDSNQTKLKEYNHNYRQTNNASITTYSKEYKQNNKNKIKESSRIYYEKNKIKITRIHKLYTQRNTKRIKEASKRYAQSIGGKLRCNIRKAKRRANKRNQTPKLTTVDTLAIKLLYKAATVRNYHVDHIIPITKGGLHHPMNLQILSPHDNLVKSDRILDNLPLNLLELHAQFYNCEVSKLPWMLNEYTP